MQNAIAKMIQKPCEANAGLEICISFFEPRSLPALAHYHPRSDSPERLGDRRFQRFSISVFQRLLRCSELLAPRFYLITASVARGLVQKVRTNRIFSSPSCANLTGLTSRVLRRA